MTKPNKSKIKNNPFFGILAAIFVSIVGMLSVYIVGNARGYDPSLTVLVRNALLMGVFLIIYYLLKPKYQGDFSLLVVVAFLTGLGFIVQYRISAAINVDFQETLIKQYSAAAIKKMEKTDSLTTKTTEPDTVDSELTRERSIDAIQEDFDKEVGLKFFLQRRHSYKHS